jgi:hypothetical protein
MNIRQQALDALQNEWGTYVERFHSLAPQERAAFLEKQGYRRFADLLAHIMAWWQDGIGCIGRYKIDRGFEHPAIDVDVYNARAVEKVAGRGESEVIADFESMRRKFVDCVGALGDADLQDGRIAKQLEMELLGHYEEHKIA